MMRARGDGIARLLVGRAGVAERHAMPGEHQIADQIETAGHFGGERDDADAARDAPGSPAGSRAP